MNDHGNQPHMALSNESQNKLTMILRHIEYLMADLFYEHHLYPANAIIKLSIKFHVDTSVYEYTQSHKSILPANPSEVSQDILNFKNRINVLFSGQHAMSEQIISEAIIDDANQNLLSDIITTDYPGYENLSMTYDVYFHPGYIIGHNDNIYQVYTCQCGNIHVEKNGEYYLDFPYLEFTSRESKIKNAHQYITFACARTLTKILQETCLRIQKVHVLSGYCCDVFLFEIKLAGFTFTHCLPLYLENYLKQQTPKTDKVSISGIELTCKQVKLDDFITANGENCHEHNGVNERLLSVNNKLKKVTRALLYNLQLGLAHSNIIPELSGEDTENKFSLEIELNIKTQELRQSHWDLQNYKALISDKYLAICTSQKEKYNNLVNSFINAKLPMIINILTASFCYDSSKEFLSIDVHITRDM